jgi:hypothetical protein
VEENNKEKAYSGSCRGEGERDFLESLLSAARLLASFVKRMLFDRGGEQMILAPVFPLLMETCFFYGSFFVGPTQIFPPFYDEGGMAPGDRPSS